MNTQRNSENKNDHPLTVMSDGLAAKCAVALIAIGAVVAQGVWEAGWLANATIAKVQDTVSGNYPAIPADFAKNVQMCATDLQSLVANVNQAHKIEQEQREAKIESRKAAREAAERAHEAEEKRKAEAEAAFFKDPKNRNLSTNTTYVSSYSASNASGDTSFDDDEDMGTLDMTSHDLDHDDEWDHNFHATANEVSCTYTRDLSGALGTYSFASGRTVHFANERAAPADEIGQNVEMFVDAGRNATLDFDYVARGVTEVLPTYEVSPGRIDLNQSSVASVYQSGLLADWTSKNKLATPQQIVELSDWAKKKLSFPTLDR